MAAMIFQFQDRKSARRWRRSNDDRPWSGAYDAVRFSAVAPTWSDRLARKPTAAARSPAAFWYPSTTGYMLFIARCAREWYGRAVASRESRLRLESRLGIHVCTSGRFSAISLPRNLIALTLSGTTLGINDGMNPRALYRNTRTESPGRGTGLKKPVSVLERGSVRRRVRSYR